MGFPGKGEIIPLETIRKICSEHGREELWERIEHNPPLSPFSSDGCSHWFDNWDGVDLYPFCFLHDLEYWVGGTDADRLTADCLLCIGIAQAGEIEMAEIMLAGVRIGGESHWRKSYSWGFGHAG